MPDNKKKNNEWGQLSMKDKAALIDIYVKHGFTDIDSIRDDYERNREHFVSSDANFVNRLRTEDTTSVDLGNGERGTHLMSYANEGEKATIFPLLQESNGTIENHSEDERAFDSAIEKGDTVNVSIPFAKFYSPRYKLDYSNFFEKFNNKYGDGGDKNTDDRGNNGKYVKPEGTSLKQDLAYRIGAFPRAYDRGYASLGDINNAITSDNVEFIPQLYAYIYGPQGIYEPISGKSSGFDYSDYLDRVGYKNVGEYKAQINPSGRYAVNNRYRGLVEELARNNSRIYDDTTTFEDGGFDVGNFIHKFGFDDNGNIVVSDSDVYDFYPGDYRYGDNKLKSYIQASLMNSVGNPYIVRQDNQPVMFFGENDMFSDIDYSDLSERLNIVSDDEIARQLGNGYIEPSVVKAERKFEDGGDKKNKFVSYMDSIWNNVKNIISGFTYKPKSDIDWSGISTSGNRTYNPENIEYINEKLDTIPPKRRAAIIGDIIEESGGNPFAESGTGKYKGLLQWGPDRALKELPKDEKEAIDKTLEYIVETMTNPNDGKSWTHGGSGSGYNSRLEPFNMFYNNDASLEDVHRAFSFGYVRPKGKQKSYENRQKVVEQVYNKLTESQNSK